MNRGQQHGAALLLAMLTVAIVATLAAGAAWQQWRAIEIEMAERQRSQSSWILTGALDWSRLILREDARGNRNSGNADHLGEPWAMPLEESRLSSFLAVDRDNNADDVMEAFLSGRMTDLQGKLNFRNLLISTGTGANTQTSLSQPDLADFRRLYAELGLDTEELESAARMLVETHRRADDELKPSDTPLMPMRYAQLGWLGLPPHSLRALAPYVTWLPARTRINLNTASEQVLAATLAGVEAGLARQLVAQREITPFISLDDIKRWLPEGLENAVDARRHDVRSQYFAVHGRLRLGDTVIDEQSMVSRSGLQVGVRWRQRNASQDVALSAMKN